MHTARSLAAVLAAAAVAAFSTGASADVRTMDFDSDAWGAPIAAGTPFAMQYAAWGVGVSANPYSGPNTSGAANLWATNTDLTISTDAGVTARTGSGNMLHSLTGWLSEDGDPSFELTFLYRIDSISAVFTGIATGDSFAGMIAYDDEDQVLAEVRVTNPAQGGAFTQTLSLTNLGAVSRVVFVPGTFDDWIGIDDIAFGDAVVPTPGAAALMGIGSIVLLRRKRK